ncbi:MAG: sigma 54-interacting transcriptional regulator [Sedimentibacter sp.]|uniref:sigma-54-dependent Fis family transcriptional regulator n=1 Tax=Sedimentibacter sp. TaxID=1960295 RepID=UPI003158660E
MQENGHENVIALSHERCKNLGLKREQEYSKKIITDANLQNILFKNRNLIMAALPYIEQLIKFTRGSNFFALLTDSEGCILNALGDEKILSEAFSLKMVPGAYMNEENMGTNAMSYVIKTERPVQLSGKDHYVNSYRRWTCSAAPIKDQNGRLLGAIDLTGYIENVHPHTLGIVVAVSKAIEEMIKAKDVCEIHVNNYNYLKNIFDSMDKAIMTTDMNGNIKMYNEVAAEMFGRNKKLKGDNINHIVEEWDSIKDYLDSNESISKHINIKALRDHFPCELEAKKIYCNQGNEFEIVHLFREEDKVKKSILSRSTYEFDRIIGKDDNFIKIVEYAKKIADSSSTVLIMGESGTGKELFAHSIHNFSSRSNLPFIALNCGAIPELLIESELFGYEDGAFTGAKKGGNPGKFELANGGTILLDEIGEMPFDMQVKLLRALEEGFITRLGSKKPIPIDVRIIASTNKDLEKEVENGRFRNDLYYRLNVLPLYIPSLRERKGDIRLLVEYFMEKLSHSLAKPKVSISEEDLSVMGNYYWPGNIRELKNIVELIINTEAMPLNYFNRKYHWPSNSECSDSDCEEVSMDMESIEKEHLEKIIKRCNGNISQSADILGIRRNTLYNKIKKYNIKI